MGIYHFNHELLPVLHSYRLLTTRCSPHTKCLVLGAVTFGGTPQRLVSLLTLKIDYGLVNPEIAV